MAVLFYCIICDDIEEVMHDEYQEKAAKKGEQPNSKDFANYIFSQTRRGKRVPIPAAPPTMELMHGDLSHYQELCSIIKNSWKQIATQRQSLATSLEIVTALQADYERLMELNDSDNEPSDYEYEYYSDCSSLDTDEEFALITDCDSDSDSYSDSDSEAGYSTDEEFELGWVSP